VRVLEPPVVVLALAFLASALFVLSTVLTRRPATLVAAVGVAGLAAWGVASADLSWWPLAGVGAAVVLWATMIASASAPFPRRVTAAALYAAGAIGFGVANGDAATLVVADTSSLVLPFLFPWVMQVAGTRLALPPRAGLEVMVGKLGTVSTWSGRSGIVRVEGGLWNAVGMDRAAQLDKVLVTDVRGISLVVVPTSPRWDQLADEG
jgi:membrane-bound ClpP family serine protease